MGKQIGGGAAGGSYREIQRIWQTKDERGRSGCGSREGKSTARAAESVAAVRGEFEPAAQESVTRCAGGAGGEVRTLLDERGMNYLGTAAPSASSGQALGCLVERSSTTAASHPNCRCIAIAAPPDARCARGTADGGCLHMSHGA